MGAWIMASPNSLGLNFSTHVEGSKNIIHRIKLMQGKLKDLVPVQQEVAAAFKEMEADIFKGEGTALKWGVNFKWAPLNPKTVASKARYGYPPDILVETEALKQASSVNPALTFYKNGSLKIVIDPRKDNPNNSGENYGLAHQYGTDRVPKRQFIPEPLGESPVFVAFINLSLKKHIWGDDVKLVQKSGSKATQIQKNIRRRKAYKELSNKSTRSAIGNRKAI
jgi:hypothetical protein